MTGLADRFTVVCSVVRMPVGPEPAAAGVPDVHDDGERESGWQYEVSGTGDIPVVMVRGSWVGRPQWEAIRTGDPGEYRICTANTDPNFCAQLTIAP